MRQLRIAYFRLPFSLIKVLQPAIAKKIPFQFLIDWNIPLFHRRHILFLALLVITGQRFVCADDLSLANAADPPVHTVENTVAFLISPHDRLSDNFLTKPFKRYLVKILNDGDEFTNITYFEIKLYSGLRRFHWQFELSDPTTDEDALAMKIDYTLTYVTRNGRPISNGAFQTAVEYSLTTNDDFVALIRNSTVGEFFPNIKRDDVLVTGGGWSLPTSQPTFTPPPMSLPPTPGPRREFIDSKSSSLAIYSGSNKYVNFFFSVIFSSLFICI